MRLSCYFCTYIQKLIDCFMKYIKYDINDE